MLLPEKDTLHTGLVKLASEHAIPNFVKEANASKVYANIDTLPLEAFGDPVHRSYPLHTKVATWISNGYFLDNYNEIEPGKRELIQDRIQKAAAYFGIEDEIERQTLEKAASIKVANHVHELPDSCYMEISTDSTGRTTKRGIIRTKEQLTKAASWLVNNRNDLSLERCTTYADRILARADELGVKVAYADNLERMCGLGANDTEDIARAIKVRADLVKDPALHKQAMALATNVRRRQLEPLSNEMYKVACAIDALDVAADLVSNRRRGELQLPEDICFNHSMGELTKIASETVHLTSGEVFSLEKIASISRLDFESAFGSDLADECYEDSEFQPKTASYVLASLPRPDAERLVTMLKSKGIEPETTTKAASAIGIPRDLYELFG